MLLFLQTEFKFEFSLSAHRADPYYRGEKRDKSQHIQLKAMETEVIETVLKELLQEQKESNLINGKIATHIKSLTDKIDNLEKRSISQSFKKTESVDFLQTLHTDVKRLQSELFNRPNVINYRKIFQFFPSFNIREYYQVYGNIVKWMSIFGCVWLLASLLREFLGKQGLV